MGSVYKKAVTKPLPPDAEIVTRKKGQYAQWKDRRGKTYSAPITTGRDGKPRIRVEAKTYTAKYRDGLGVVHEHATGCRGKRAAEMVLAKLEEEAEKVKAGVLTSVESEMSKHRDTSLLEHVDEYITHQTAKGVNAQRVKSTKSRLLRLAEQCNLRRLTDISADALERWMLEKAEYDDRTKKPMGAGARNGYRESAIGFGNWLVRKKRIPANPFADVPKADAKADCRRKRRALNEDELRRLLDVARRRPLEDAMTIRRGPKKGQRTANIRPEVRERKERLGRERSLIYKTMALTGLRKNELATLLIGWLELDAEPPHLILDPKNEKNREGNSIPLRSDLAEDLRAWIAEKSEDDASPDAPLFNVPTGLLRILDRDLKAAGIPKKDCRGRTVDIHALRHTFGTMLSAAGVKPRTAQEAMRHSDIKLTMNVYTDPALLDVAGAVESLPELPIDRGQPNRRPLRSQRKLKEPVHLQFAPEFAPTTGHPGQSGAIPVKMAVPDDPPPELLSRAVKSCYDNSKGPLSTRDNDPFKVGAIVARLNRRGRRGTRLWPRSSRCRSRMSFVRPNLRHACCETDHARRQWPVLRSPSKRIRPRRRKAFRSRSSVVFERPNWFL